MQAAMDVLPAADQLKIAKARRGSVGGQKPAWWTQLVVMSGWMHKKGGMTKSWQRRFFILYNTSQVDAMPVRCPCDARAMPSTAQNLLLYHLIRRLICGNLRATSLLTTLATRRRRSTARTTRSGICLTAA
jgi:hypothetical protein